MLDMNRVMWSFYFPHYKSKRYDLIDMFKAKENH